VLLLLLLLLLWQWQVLMGLLCASCVVLRWLGVWRCSRSSWAVRAVQADAEQGLILQWQGSSAQGVAGL
jgi:hypothetical protein